MGGSFGGSCVCSGQQAALCVQWLLPKRLSCPCAQWLIAGWLHPPWPQGPLVELRQLCNEVHGMRLHALLPGKAYLLPEYVEAHAEQRAACEARLAAFTHAAADLVASTCAEGLARVEERLRTFSVKQSATIGLPALRAGHTTALMGAQMQQGGSTGAVGGFEYTQVSMWRVNCASSDWCAHDTSTQIMRIGCRQHSNGVYMHAYNPQAAARRMEQRRLLAFVRLADCMMAEALHSVLMASIREVLTTLHSSNISSGGSRGAGSSIGGGSARHGLNGSGSSKAPPAAPQLPPPAAFAVELLLCDDGERLQYQPDPRSFRAAMSSVLEGFLVSVASLPRLGSLPAVMAGLEGAIEAVGERGSLEDMVAAGNFRQLVRSCLV